MNSDAWVGLFKSLDGGQHWKQHAVPGYPQDPAHTAPLWGYHAATDPFIRAGTNGMFYYAGLAFNRGEHAPSAIFVARYMDMNNLEAGDPIVHLDTRIVDSDPGARFLDKTALATDIPRTAATCAFNVPLGDAARHRRAADDPAGNVYLAYSVLHRIGRHGTIGHRLFPLDRLRRDVECAQDAEHRIAPGAERPDRGRPGDRLRLRLVAALQVSVARRRRDGGALHRRRGDVREGRPGRRRRAVRPADQRDVVPVQRLPDDGGRWQRPGLSGVDRSAAMRSLRPSPVDGDARIVVSTSTNGTAWTVPQPIQPGGLGHQLMPALTFHAGRLRLLYYDLREDVSQVFAPFVDEFHVLQANSHVRHTHGCLRRAGHARAWHRSSRRRGSRTTRSASCPTRTSPSACSSTRRTCRCSASGRRPSWGTTSTSPRRRPTCRTQTGAGRTTPPRRPAPPATRSGPTTATCARPRDGDWINYSPPRSAALPANRAASIRRSDVPACYARHDGMRNQNIYTARVTEGLFVSAPGNNKPLGDLAARLRGGRRKRHRRSSGRSGSPSTINRSGARRPSSSSRCCRRSTSACRRSRPSRARSLPPRSDERARVNVSLVEITAPGGHRRARRPGRRGRPECRSQSEAPRLQNPRLQNPRLQNPLIADGEAYNAGITNAVFAVPRLQNPRLQNPTIENPRLQNDALGNPRLQNDAIAESRRGQRQPAPTRTWRTPACRTRACRIRGSRTRPWTTPSSSTPAGSLTNDGNTTAAYTINLVLNEPIPTGFASQLLIHKTTTTPAVHRRATSPNSCTPSSSPISRIPSSCRSRRWPTRGCRIPGCRTRRWRWRRANPRR